MISDLMIFDEMKFDEKTFDELSGHSHKLSDYQNKKRVLICKMLISKHKNENFLNLIIIGDDKWVMYNNCNHKRQ